MVFHTLSQKLTTTFIHLNIIPESDRDIYIYSFELLLSAIINLVVAAVMIAVSGQVLGGVVFVGVFLILRQSVGGYHAKTHFRCILSFTVIFGVFLAVLMFLPALYRLPVILASLVFSVPVIVLCAPVAHVNKPLSEMEQLRLGRLAKLLGVTLTLLIMVGVYLFSGNVLSLSAALAMLTVSLSALFGRFYKGH